MGQVESAIDRARRSGEGKVGPWAFVATAQPPVGILSHYGTPIFRVNLKTGAAEVGANAWGSVSDQTGIRKAAAHLSRSLGITVTALLKKDLIAARERARAKGAAFSNPGMTPHTPRTPAGPRGVYAIDARHAHIGKGLVYCEDFKDSAAPVITHSRVKCGLCGKTIQSAVNPFRVHKAPQIFHGGIAHGRPPTALPRRSFKSRGMGLPLRRNPPQSPATLFLRARMMEGDSPAQALRAAAKQFAGRASSKVLRAGFHGIMTGLEDALEEGRHHLSPWAAAAVQRYMGYRKFAPHRNPGHGRRVGGAVNSPRLIYGRATTLSVGPDGKVRQMTARKMAGPYKGKDFVHEFKPGVKHIGLPRGTQVRTPDGQTFKMPNRTALMVGPKNLWADFAA